MQPSGVAELSVPWFYFITSYQAFVGWPRMQPSLLFLAEGEKRTLMGLVITGQLQYMGLLVYGD
jgi:hypothetical protein